MTDPRVIKIISDRKAVYEAKRNRADPLAEDTLTDFEAYARVIEAFEWLEAEIESVSALEAV